MESVEELFRWSKYLAKAIHDHRTQCCEFSKHLLLKDEDAADVASSLLASMADIQFSMKQVEPYFLQHKQQLHKAVADLSLPRPLPYLSWIEKTFQKAASEYTWVIFTISSWLQCSDLDRLQQEVYQKPEFANNVAKTLVQASKRVAEYDSIQSILEAIESESRALLSSTPSQPSNIHEEALVRLGKVLSAGEVAASEERIQTVSQHVIGCWTHWKTLEACPVGQTPSFASQARNALAIGFQWLALATRLTKCDRVAVLLEVSNSPVEVEQPIVEALAEVDDWLDSPPEAERSPQGNDALSSLTAPQRRIFAEMLKHKSRVGFEDLRVAWDKDVSESGIAKALKRIRKSLDRSQWDFEISEANYEVIWHKKGQIVP